MGWGWTLEIPGRKTLAGHGSIDPKPSNTNNQAEYLALGYGLKAVAELREREGGFEGLIVQGDSKLVVEQINERWAVNSPSIRGLHARCTELVRSLMPASVEWVPREHNQAADEESRAAYRDAEGCDPPERKKRSA